MAKGAYVLVDAEGAPSGVPDLILIGGMDNTDTLIHGPVERIVAEAREIIDLGRDGGVVIGTHSLSPEIPLENLCAYRETCLSC